MIKYKKHTTSFKDHNIKFIAIYNKILVLKVFDLYIYWDGITYIIILYINRQNL